MQKSKLKLGTYVEEKTLSLGKILLYADDLCCVYFVDMKRCFFVETASLKKVTEWGKIKTINKKRKELKKELRINRRYNKNIQHLEKIISKYKKVDKAIPDGMVEHGN